MSKNEDDNKIDENEDDKTSRFINEIIAKDENIIFEFHRNILKSLVDENLVKTVQLVEMFELYNTVHGELFGVK